MAAEAKYTSINDISGIVAAAHKTYETGRTKPVAWRKQQLRKLSQMLKDEKNAVHQALHHDLRQTAFLADVAELDGLLKEIDYTLSNIDDWVKPEKKSVPLLAMPASAYVMKEPFGTVLIIGPWNYPIRLVLLPLIGAIAAGNCAVLKPSEVAAACGEWVAKTLPKYLDTEAFKVVTGGPQETTELLKQRFDKIFYTGNGFVGRIVMKAAAEHLTPVVLELGGKSPVIVDESVDLDVACKRIIWGKFSNDGQTCVAPDYILAHKNVEQKLLNKLKSTIEEFYGSDPQKSPDLSRIVNSRHFDRLEKLLSSGRVYYGGKTLKDDLYIAPTILQDVPGDSAVMKDEIFGPILPVVKVDSVDEAISFVNKRDKPLALYIFSRNSRNVNKVLENTSSGGVSVNDTVLHIACPDMHFGGIGESGMGAYNGRHTFDTFSHEKPVLDKPTWSDPSIRYPPYTPFKIKAFTGLMKLELPSFKMSDTAKTVITGLSLGAAAYMYYKHYIEKI